MSTNRMDPEHRPSMPEELAEALASRVARAQGILGAYHSLDAFSEWLAPRKRKAPAEADPLIREAEALIGNTRIAMDKNLDYLKRTLERFRGLTWGQTHYYSVDILIHEWRLRFDEAINGVRGLAGVSRLQALKSEIEALTARQEVKA